MSRRTCVFLLALTGLFPPLTVAIAADPLAWPPVTAQARPWTWWWWHGSAVDQANLARKLAPDRMRLARSSHADAREE